MSPVGSEAWGPSHQPASGGLFSTLHSSKATDCLGPWAALLLGLLFGSSGASSEFGKLLEVFFFFSLL